MHMNMENETYPRRRRTPSFSSTLLDAICRSIDESKSNLDKDQQLGLFKETTTHNTSKQSNLNYYKHNNHRVSVEKSSTKERMNLRRAVMIEDWMEKQSSLSSSESSSGTVFSSSEADTTHKPKPRISKHMKINSEKIQQQQKPHREGGFTRTKLRALKFYGVRNESPPESMMTSLTTVKDRVGHQKVKQPISPGSRIASFLSSIFNSGNVKKAKMCYVGAVEDVSFEHKSSKSPCFSSSTTASSFSRRSCMSKSAHSSEKGKNSNGVKSVRFYPVSVILGEDSQKPSCHRYSFENDPSLLPLPSVRRITRSSSKKELKKINYVMPKEKGEEAASLDFIKGCENSSGKSGKFGFRDFYDNGEDEGDEDDDDDAWSYSSSDLFELDHIIGARRYQEELPVYETTNLETNKAIANGLRL